MIVIKQIEKDMLVLATIHEFAKAEGKILQDYLDEELDKDSFNKLASSLEFMKSHEAAEDAFRYLANDVYKRVKKKFLKGDTNES